MPDALTVSVADLREALSRLLGALEREYGAEIDLGADFYWVVDRSVAYNLDRPEAAGLTVGQLSDDIESLRSMLGVGVRPEALWHDLAHLIGILSGLAAMWTRAFRGPGTGPFPQDSDPTLMLLFLSTTQT